MDLVGGRGQPRLERLLVFTDARDVGVTGVNFGAIDLLQLVERLVTLLRRRVFRRHRGNEEPSGDHADGGHQDPAGDQCDLMTFHFSWVSFTAASASVASIVNSIK